jgi:hypothetical protein
VDADGAPPQQPQPLRGARSEEYPEYGARAQHHHAGDAEDAGERDQEIFVHHDPR